MNENEQKIPLETFFTPAPGKGIVIFGATDQLDQNGQVKLGQKMTENILASFKGKVFLINPTRETVLGQKCYKNLSELEGRPDLSIVVTPAKTVPEIVEQCASAGIPSTVILSAGFEEVGEEGKKLAEEVKRIANGRTRIAGPNCFGVVGPDMNCTFSRGNPAVGNIGVISQSGGILSWLLDMDPESGMGISRAASTGSMLDVTWAEWLKSFGDDESTKTIAIYMEQLGKDSAGFIKTAREVSKKKMIVALKAGRTKESGKAAASHTGALVGNDAVYNEAFRHSGILRADTSEELFRLLKLSKQELPKGDRLAVITNGGGSAVLATDALVLAGGKLAELSPETISKLNTALPSTWSHGNPIDVIGDATPERYRVAIESALQDQGNDGVSVTHVPVAMSAPEDIANVIVESHKKYPSKPIFASFAGAKSVKGARKILIEAGIPVFSTTEAATKTFGVLSGRAKWLKHAEEHRLEPKLVIERTPEMEKADEILRVVRESGRTFLTEHESKEVFRAYGIPATETFIAGDENEAIVIAEKIGYPVVLKLNSTTLSHKTDVKGVVLNLRTQEEIKGAWSSIRNAINEKDFHGVAVQKMESGDGEEVLIGAKTDPSFGHVIVFGQGGTRTEYYKDTALSILPIDTTSAEDLMARTQIYKILKNGWRGSSSSDMSRLANILVAFSHFLETHPEVKEVDINPLIVLGDHMVALDARIILHEA